MKVYVQFSDASKTKVVSVFAGAQDNNVFPNQSQIQDSDPRYLAFIGSHTTTAERIWRDSELLRADNELNKVQDADPKAIGTVADWRNYRKALRAYSAGGVRPISPA